MNEEVARLATNPTIGGTPLVGVTGDLYLPDGTLAFHDMTFDPLVSAGIELRAVGEGERELDPVELSGLEGALVFGPQVTARSLKGADRLLVVARLGVGLDNVDVDACSKAGVLVTTTPDAVRRPMATSGAVFVLALAHRLLIKDHLTRTGGWNASTDYMGVGLAGRSLGLLGFGNIGREMARLLRPFDLQILTHDPYVDPQTVDAEGVDHTDLETLMSTSDFVCVVCPLTTETFHLVDGPRLRMMKPTAYLINIARGAIVDQGALIEVLKEGRIAGAALDVFEQEPLPSDNPLLEFDSVIATPHSIGWTDELARLCAASACEAVLSVLSGRVPRFVVNREALAHPRVAGLRSELKSR